MATQAQLNIKTLIRHYENAPDGVKGWGYNQCAAGIAYQLNITRSIDTGEFGRALGVTYSQALDIVGGAGSVAWMLMDSEQKRDCVIAMLQGLLVEGVVDWRRTKI
jgi:hypothetical protein